MDRGGNFCTLATKMVVLNGPKREAVGNEMQATYVDQYGIKRSHDEERYPEQMRFHLATVIKEPLFHPFFGITQEEAARVRDVCEFFGSSSFGTQRTDPDTDDLELYRTVLSKYLSCPSSSPHFVLPQEDGTFIFCMEYTKVVRAIKSNIW